MKQAILIFAVLCLIGCNDNFLETRPSKALVVPTSLTDFQSLLDNSWVMNMGPAFNPISDGDFIFSDEALSVLSTQNRNSYLWKPNIYEGTTFSNNDWDLPYQQIFYSNVILDGLKEMKPDTTNQYKQISGSALFFRAMAYYNLIQNFSVPYAKQTANKDPGVPLALTADVTVVLPRSTIQKNYDQIIADLLEARELLPDLGIPVTRPGKVAANALLSKVYLAMEDYESAFVYADEALQIKNDLIDYNTLTPSSANPFPFPFQQPNNEIIFYQRSSNNFASSSNVFVDDELYNSYDTTDLRQRIFYTDEKGYKGSYCGSTYQFPGIATDELYLIRAECSARSGSPTAALKDLNILLRSRYKTNSFSEYHLTDQEGILRLILHERRKELVARSLRWTDLRRLNKDSRFQATLNRTYQGISYSLPPNSTRYTFPIPDTEIAGSGIEQNRRVND